MLKQIIIVLSLLSLSSCGGNNVNKKPIDLEPVLPKITEIKSKKLEVALLLPLTGEHSDFGNNMMQATQLAFKELKTRNVNIQSIDTGSDITSSDQIIKALEGRKYDIILGPVFFHHTKIAYSYAYKNQIPVISFSNDISLLNNEGLFLIGVMPDQIINRVVNYAALNGYNKLFSLLPENRYGLFIENTIRNNSLNSHYEIVESARYIHSPSGALSNAENALTIIKAAMIKQATSVPDTVNNFALLVPEGGEFIKQITLNISDWARENRIRLKFLGSNLWDEENLLTLKHLNGAWIATAPNAHLKYFEQRFYNSYGSKPFKLSALAYDAAALVTVLSNKENIVQAILDENGFLGASGIFRFKKDGSNERALSIFEIRNGKLIEIDEAKGTFNN